MPFSCAARLAAIISPLVSVVPEDLPAARRATRLGVLWIVFVRFPVNRGLSILFTAFAYLWRRSRRRTRSDETNGQRLRRALAVSRFKVEVIGGAAFSPLLRGLPLVRARALSSHVSLGAAGLRGVSLRGAMSARTLSRVMRGARLPSCTTFKSPDD